MLDHQEPTMTNRPRIVIYENDEIVSDSADPATYTVLDHPAGLLAPLATTHHRRAGRPWSMIW